MKTLPPSDADRICRQEIRRRAKQRAAARKPGRKVVPRRDAETCGGFVRIHLTRGKSAIVDLCDSDLASFNWTATPADAGVWYARRAAKGVCILLHRVVAERAGMEIVGVEVDHKDRDGLNCRRGNLRVATRPQNAFNSKRPVTNTSGFRGVYWQSRCRKWVAAIRIAGRVTFLGHFLNAEDAAAAYASAAIEHRGEFARLS